MQIHELTLRKKTNEGLLDTIKGAGQKALKTFNDPSALTSNSKFASAQADERLQTATKDFVAKMAAEWPTVAQTITAKSAAASLPHRQAAAGFQSQAKRATQQAQAGKQQPSPATPTTPTATPGRHVSRTRGGQMSGQLARSKTGQQMQKMFGTPKGGIQDLDSDLQEAFGDLPGAKPQAGGPVDPKVTKGVGRQGNPLASAYITTFKNWVRKKVATRESNTGETLGLETAEEQAGLSTELNKLLTNIYATRNDPAANQKAVTAYLTKVVTTIQQRAAELRKSNPKSAARLGTKSAPGQMDPKTAQMARAMNLSQDNLNKMKQVITAAGEKVYQGTGAPTIDELLVSAGLLK